MKRTKILPYIIALSALSVSGSAAFYSVYGLSKLFAGASTQVIIMTGSLEVAKLVVASLLYQYWSTINKALRTYLLIACFILMVITSGGIYGFLSGAYQSTAIKSELLDKSLAVLNQKQIRFEESKNDLKLEKDQLNKSISDLRIALSNPAQVQYVDRETGQLITTSSGSSRRALQGELKFAIADRNKTSIRLEAFTDSLTSVDMQILNKEISNEDERELGPLRYIAELADVEMDRVVNWFLLLIIFVFDPLAIALIVAANFAFSRLNIKRPLEIDEYFKERNDHLEKVMMSVPEGLEYDKPYSIEEIKEALPKESEQEKIKEDYSETDAAEHYTGPEPVEKEEVDKKEDEVPDINKSEILRRSEKLARAAGGQVRIKLNSGSRNALKEAYKLLRQFENRG